MENLYLFFTVSLLINISPGPDMIYTAARSLSQGSRAGVLSAIGIFCGCFFHIGAAVLGLSVIIAESATLFNIIKILGAGYLIYLGTRSILSRQSSVELNDVQKSSYQKIFMQGLITNVLNPKVALFFLSFLPQFIHPESPNFKQHILFLGMWFAVQGTLILIVVALLTGYFRQMLETKPGFWKWQERITGSILVILGIKLLFNKR